ncbi:eIF4G eukaryotic initiation factor 4 and Nic domain-containing protein [Cryptosporidium canis]|nr:eIF4G eukaryotic initiation factor 4 and Nic domain-containing protein [Cryptosporidium canis]
MVVEKQQERPTNDKKRKFRRPFQRSPTNGAQKGSISKEKDSKIHNRYISASGNANGDLQSGQAEGSLAKDSKDVNGNSSEVVIDHGGGGDNTVNNEPRLNSHKHNNNTGHANKSFPSSDGGAKDQYYGNRGDSSERPPHSTGPSAFIAGGEGHAKANHTKGNKPGRIHPNQQSLQQQQPQQQNQSQHHTGQHPKQMSQRPSVSNFQPKHQTYGPPGHNVRHDGRYNQDRRVRGYGYPGNKHHNPANSSGGGGYDSNRRQPAPGPAGGGTGSNPHASQTRPSQYGKPSQQSQSNNSAAGATESSTSANAAIPTDTVVSSTHTASGSTGSSSNQTKTTSPGTLSSGTATKEEGGKQCPPPGNGANAPKKDAHGAQNRRGDQHYHGHARQQSQREYSNYNQIKDGSGKVAHGNNQRDSSDGVTKESRTNPHKGFSNGKPGPAATATATGSDSEQRPTGNVEHKQKVQTHNHPQQQQQQQSSTDHDSVAKSDSGDQRDNTEHVQGTNVAVTGQGSHHSGSHHNHHNSGHLPNNNGGGSWKGQNGGDHTGSGQNVAYSKHPVDGGHGHGHGHGHGQALGSAPANGALSDDFKRKKNKKRFNKATKGPSATTGGQAGNSQQAGAQVKERPKYSHGDQAKAHEVAEETVPIHSPNENESKNSSSKGPNGGVGQQMSAPETGLEKERAADSRRRASGGLTESVDSGNGGSKVSGSDRTPHAPGDLQGDSVANAGSGLGAQVSGEKARGTECPDLNENHGSPKPSSVSETRAVDAEVVEGAAAVVSKDSASDHNAGSGVSSGGTGVAVGPWRRALHGNQVVDSLETVRRAVKSLLNKITVEKFTVIAEKLAVCIDGIKDVDELEELVKQVLDKAITEPDFSEMYADLCQILKWRSPVLLNRDGKSSIGFSRALLVRCEQEFKNMPRNMTPTEEERDKYDSDELAILYRKRKLHVLGIIRLIGELFIRKMFPMRSLNELVFDLVMIQENPDEYAIECLCQLIMTTGYYLDSNEKSQMIVDQWFGRLRELQNTSISTRLNCLIQDVFDLRKHKWVKKVHKQKAKALADILKDIDVEDVLGGAAIAAQYGSMVVVGERSNLVGNSAYYNYMTSQEELYMSKQRSLQKQ